MDDMHPIIRQALAAFAPAESKEMAEYRNQLRRFDWSFEFSDDSSVVRRARVELKTLRAMQAQLDPDGSIWRAVAPGGFGEPEPVVDRLRELRESGGL